MTTSPGTVTLYAFDPSTIQAGQAMQLYAGSAGTWPSPGNANIVPLVAGGRVYVASYKQLAIFGLGAPRVAAQAAKGLAAPAIAPTGSDHALWGTVASFNKSTVVLRLRTGRAVRADISAIAGKLALIRFQPGAKVLVHGSYDARGVFWTIAVERAKDSPALWGQDY